MAYRRTVETGCFFNTYFPLIFFHFKLKTFTAFFSMHCMKIFWKTGDLVCGWSLKDVFLWDFLKSINEIFCCGRGIVQFVATWACTDEKIYLSSVDIPVLLLFLVYPLFSLGKEALHLILTHSIRIGFVWSNFQFTSFCFISCFRESGRMWRFWNARKTTDWIWLLNPGSNKRQW